MEVRVLGPVEVGIDGRTVALGGPKERAALALLAVHAGRFVSIEFLVDGVWGEEPPRTADKTLQTYVFRIRRALAEAGAPETLVTEPGGYRLDVPAIAVDAAAFELDVAAAREARAAGDAVGALRLLEAAEARWRGDAFADLSGSAVLQAERTRLAELRLSAVEQRIELELEVGSERDLVAELGRLVSAHPLRERLWAQLMVALYRAGRQGDALRAFQAARARLVDELGIDPGPELQELEARVLAQDPTLARPVAVAVAARSDDVRPPAGDGGEGGDSGPTWLPLLPQALAATLPAHVVGRADELAALEAAWAAAAGGATRAVLLAGEPGIGKTTLAAAIARSAHAAGAVVLFGRSDEAGIIPYQPFVEALREYAAQAPQPILRHQLGDLAGDLSRLLPELRTRVPDLVSGGEEIADRSVLFGAVASLLARIAARHTVVLVVDDLHWADQATLLLLRHVLRHPQSNGLLVVGTYRDTEVGRTHPLAESLVVLRRDELVDRIVVGGLAAADVEAMVRDLLPSDGPAAPHDLAARIAAETEGNPFFVRELVRHLADDPAAGERVAVPEGVQEVIGRRLARLPDAANDVLRAAAVVGRAFEPPVVAAACGFDEDAVLDVLDAATAAGLVREVPGSGAAYEFAHALVRRTLYEELSASRRVRLHTRVADALEALERRRPGSRTAELAHHLAEAAQSGDVDRAVAYAMQAGDAAMAQFAFEEAERHFRRAAEMLELADQVDPRRRAEVLLALGDAIGRADQVGAAPVLFQAAAEARTAGAPDLLARAAVAAVGRSIAIVEDHGEGELLAEAEGLLDDSDPMLVRVLCARTQWDAVRGDADALARMSRRTLALAHRSRDPELIAMGTNARLFVLRELADTDEQLTLGNELLHLGLATNRLDLVARAHRSRAWAMFERGAFDAWADALAEHDHVAGRLRDTVSALMVQAFRAMRLLIDGDFETCDGVVREILTDGVRMSSAGELNALPTLFGLRWLQGRAAEMEPLFLEAAQRAVRIGPFMTGSAVAAAADGRVDDARRYLAEALPAGVAGVPQRRLWAPIMFHLAVLQPQLGDPALAREVYDQLSPYADLELTHLGRLYQGSVSHHLGVVATVMEQPALAVRHLEAALVRHRTLGSPPWTALTEHALADALLARGDPDDAERAGALATSARSTANDLGMKLPPARSTTSA